MAAITHLPPSNYQQERIICSITAAEKYEVPANILLAIAEKENGKPGVWVKNTNGTHDIGPMQFNTAYLKTLAKFGISPKDVANSGCYAFDLAAWRIHAHLSKDAGDIWTRAANYHSRTLQHNTVYRADLIKKSNRWANWLDKFMQTTSAKINSYKTKRETNQISEASSKISTVKKAYVPRKIFVTDH